MFVQNNVHLAPHTTLQLGGEAKYFISIKTIEDLRYALEFCKNENLPFFILGGGSNTIFRDSGFPGVIFKMQIPGIRCLDSNNEYSIFQVGAGVIWDHFVEFVVKQGLAGVECLSGIPGSVGASPIQNIGAYGQEVKDSILEVECMNPSGEIISIKNQNCNFRYRNSEFKSGIYKDYIVISVTFQLSKEAAPCLRYPELQNLWETSNSENFKNGKSNLESRIQQMEMVRNLVVQLRKKKSMVLDENDPNARSAGSFFTNPILSDFEAEKFIENAKKLGFENPPIYSESPGYKKLSAAWLIENSGIQKGTKYPGGVGISDKHCLGLINIEGSTSALLKMAESVRQRVLETFFVRLEMEPVLIP
ncbi:UDP-N-acetylmuramate dehydrogenase [Leptospira bandrabouensis]|uniref:UDP-N-acetylenolpyruvoylglucosamine reductase n=1 Tax=Leptospira bandrabouensis TaxID=2484903 RepID=A0A6H3NVR7_9LEPT|nr:UDP-N-acetylmuramate dehydrogenase [Leptospira bandrabouensis]MCG6144068.1 UDP-N-acetylmuramate dehydrogenase [Leptospira bandrabouensis]MCG6150891.1 UDP-N-acetylmuramate dehydrogenase [Leptospira bandrabouensis]MCG6159729.1 UDP-N-acetylmuramate dehydrogenase [Leptospira bandrabouensis]MCG6163662.1 UDP-N-acetylmuramate dehydrogenase [Leptospira bandrabouensis]TGN05293.1 UDP-N-acetylmuramate dehydrogenase [Leptospira bandrabouensis]